MFNLVLTYCSSNQSSRNKAPLLAKVTKILIYCYIIETDTLPATHEVSVANEIMCNNVTYYSFIC